MRLAKATFPRLKHVTCLAHAMNRVSEAIRNNHPLCDKFIENMKKLLTNSPKRKEQFHTICALPLP